MLNTMVFAAYACTTLNYVLYCISRFVKEKKMMLILDIIAKILTIAGLYLLGSMSGAYSFAIMLLTLIFATIKESCVKKNEERGNDEKEINHNKKSKKKKEQENGALPYKQHAVFFFFVKVISYQKVYRLRRQVPAKCSPCR